MKAPIAMLALLAIGASHEQPPRTYLMSVSGIRLSEGQRISAFAVKSWAVTYLAVCHMPSDWEITAGSFGMQGRLLGEAGHGAAYLNEKRLSELHQIALVAFSGPVQKRDKSLPDGVIPATFGGRVTVDLGKEDRSQKMALTSANVALEPAKECPLRG